jgi:hypothetical protein
MSAATDRHDLDGVLAVPRAAVAAALGLGTALRGARVFHPHGASHAVRVVVEGGQGWGSALLDRPATHEGLVRLSRGLGLPSPLPDVEGLALRLPGLGAGGAPLDLLVNSAWRFTFAPRALAPTWSSILAFRTGTGRRVLLGARPVEGGFDLLAAAPLGRWARWGRLELGAPFDGEDLRFDPTLGADDLQPVPLFRTLRRWSYDASQAGRPAERDSGYSTGRDGGASPARITSASPATSSAAAGSASAGGV